MERDYADLMTTSAALERGTPVYADSSSLIVLDKLELLESFAAFARIALIDGVEKELGTLATKLAGVANIVRPSTADTPTPPRKNASKTPLPLEPAEIAFILHPLKTTDRALVEAALPHRAPILAEDRRILRAAEDLDLPVIDSLSAALILHLANRIPAATYQNARATLATTYRYAPPLLARADNILFYHQKMT